MAFPSTALQIRKTSGPKNRAGMRLSLSLFCVLLTSRAIPALAQGSLPDGPGKDALAASCTVCHGLNLITGTRRSLPQWEETVNDMVARGAPLLEGEREIVIQYLGKHFGPEAEKVNLNQASAKQLETAFGLPAKDAEAIVRYREQKGNFRYWEDLEKVPGIDLQKLEVQKDRVSF